LPDEETIRRAVVARRALLARELEEMVSELELLRQVGEILGGADADAGGGSDADAGADGGGGGGQPLAGGTSVPAARRGTVPASRPRRSGRGQKRSDQALQMIAAEPGITPAELSRLMKIQPQYLYRILPRLARAGAVAKRGQGYVLAGEARVY
jgi:hypothetical protein